MKKVIPNQTYNMHQIGVVLKGYQINNDYGELWATIHSDEKPFTGDLQKEMEVLTLKYITEGNY